MVAYEEFKNKGEVHLGNPKSGSGRLREWSLMEFKNKGEVQLSNPKSGRGRLREWSLMRV